MGKGQAIMNLFLYFIYFIFLFNAVSCFRRGNFRDGELMDRIVFTTTRDEDPSEWFNQENPQFEYIGQVIITD